MLPCDNVLIYKICMHFRSVETVMLSRVNKHYNELFNTLDVTNYLHQLYYKKKISRHFEGSISRIGQFKDSMQDGLWVSFDIKGNITERMFYINGETIYHYHKKSLDIY